MCIFRSRRPLRIGRWKVVRRAWTSATNTGRLWIRTLLQKTTTTTCWLGHVQPAKGAGHRPAAGRLDRRCRTEKSACPTNRGQYRLRWPAQDRWSTNGPSKADGCRLRHRGPSILQGWWDWSHRRRRSPTTGRFVQRSRCMRGRHRTVRSRCVHLAQCPPHGPPQRGLAFRYQRRRSEPR